MEGYIAEIRFFAADFAPKNWAFCSGQLLPINQNQALFSLLGTTFGGNGITTFALPDFRGRTAYGVGQGGGLSSVTLGQAIGSSSSTVLISNLPSHTHTLSGSISMGATATAGNLASPVGNYPANDGSGRFDVQHDNVTLLPANNGLVVNNTGGSQPVSNFQPYLAINHIICLFGIFPSRN